MLSGMSGNEDTARAMARQLKGLSKGQLRMMAKAAAVVQNGAAMARKAKDFLLRNKLILVAILILLLAVFLRWLGVM